MTTTGPTWSHEKKARIASPAWLECAAAAIFLIVVVATPWLRTPLDDGRLRALESVQVVGCALWIVSFLVQRRRPAIARTSLAIPGALVLVGAFLALNAHTHYDGLTGTLIPTRSFSALPGSVDRSVSIAATLQLLMLLATAFALADLLRSPRRRRAWVWALALNGGAVGLLGMLDRFHIGPIRFPQLLNEGIHFGPFAYHANAAAFLNLALPAAAALVSKTVGRMRPLAVLLLVAVVVGCLSHASKAGLVVALLVAGSLLLAERPAERRYDGSVARSAVRWLVVLGLAGAFLVGLLANRNRWRSPIARGGSGGARLEAWRVIAGTVWDRPGGLGPGGLKVVFPHEAIVREPRLLHRWVMQKWVPGKPISMWMQAHNDLLQFTVEWGVLGGALALAGAVLLLRTLATAQGRPSTVLRCGRIALIAVLLHSLVDFPLQVPAIQLVVVSWVAICVAETRSSHAGNGVTR